MIIHELSVALRRVVELGVVEKQTLRNKILIKARNDLDYERTDPTGMVVLDSSGNRIAKVLDVIGNVNSPYVLAMPIVDNFEFKKEKVYLEIIEKKGKKRGGRK